MLTRFEVRQYEARRVAANIYADYGGDIVGAWDRVPALCHDQKWLTRMVKSELYHMANPKTNPKAAQKERHYLRLLDAA